MAYQKKCYYCDEGVSWRELHIDHFIPSHTDLNLKKEILIELKLDLSFDFNGLKNVVPAHSSCNTARKGKYVPTAVSFSGALVITEKYLPRILEIKERLDSEENYDSDVAQMAAYLEKGYITPERLYDNLRNDDGSFVEIEDLDSIPARVCTKNVMVHCYLPKFPEIHGSMMIAFQSLRIRDCFITFSHSEIVNTIFQGIGSSPEDRFRGFIVATDIVKNICIVQLGNNRFTISLDEARQLCDLIDKVALRYINAVRSIEMVYKTESFEYSQNNRFRLLKISRSLWKDILEFAHEFDYENGDTEWHIFDGKAIYLKVFCKIPEDSVRDYRVFIYPEAEGNELWGKFTYVDDEVWLCWEPSILIDSEEDMIKFQNNALWSAEYSYAWLRTRLIPRVIEHAKQKSSFLRKVLRGRYKVTPFDRSDLEFDYTEHNQKKFTDIKDLKTIKTCVDEFQRFFAIHSRHFLSVTSIKGIYKATILCLQHFRLNQGTLGYINIKLDGNRTLETIVASIEQKLCDLEYKAGVNGSNVEYALRSLCAVFREGELASDENIFLQELIADLVILNQEFSLLRDLERARLL